MSAKEFQIVEFQEQHQQAVEDLVLPIQQLEFGVAISRDEQADLVDIKAVFQKGSGNFWVALHGSQVVGTIGVIDIGDNQVALKKMFVHQDYRGKQSGVAAALMSRAKEWCRQNAIELIFLGTTPQMAAAHRFYEKNGFTSLEQNQLPPTFHIVHVDSKFYVCNLNS